MSTKLFWRPSPTDKTELSVAMKAALRELINDNRPGMITLIRHDILYLSGVKHGGSPQVYSEAETLIQAIDRHGSIQVWLE